MKKTNLDKLIEREIQKDPSLEYDLNRVSQAIDVAIQIYTLRRQKKLTQAQLANIAHVRQSNIARLESAEYEGYSKKTLEKIAHALDVDLAIILMPKEKTNNINTMLNIVKENQTGYAVFPGSYPGWIKDVRSIFTSGLIINNKNDRDSRHEVKAEITGVRLPVFSNYSFA